MNQTKIFSSREGFTGLETQINDWLKENEDIDIVSVDYTDNNSYCSALMVYRHPIIMQIKPRRILKYATGQEVPAGAIFLTTITNGTMGDPDRPEDYKFVWHYFLVEEE